MRRSHAVIDDGARSIQPKAVSAGRAGRRCFALFRRILLIGRWENHTDPIASGAPGFLQYCRADQRNEETGEIYDNRPWVMKGGENPEGALRGAGFLIFGVIAPRREDGHSSVSPMRPTRTRLTRKDFS